jgi:hypothetical protein
MRIPVWLALSLVLGCEDDEEERAMEYSVSLPAGSELTSIAQDDRALLVVDGRERGRFVSTGGAHVQVAAGERLAGRPLAVRFAGACGSVDVPIEVLGGAAEEERRRHDYGVTTVMLRATVDEAVTPPHDFVMLDNLDGASAGTVVIGELELAVAARSGGRRKLLVGACERPPEVRSGGRTLGRLPEADADHAVLVDLAGGHCYRWTPLLYASEGSAPTTRDDRRSERFTGGPLHVVPLAGWVLEDAPLTLSSQATVVHHSELVREPCPTP